MQDEERSLLWRNRALGGGDRAGMSAAWRADLLAGITHRAVIGCAERDSDGDNPPYGQSRNSRPGRQPGAWRRGLGHRRPICRHPALKADGQQEQWRSADDEEVCEVAVVVGPADGDEI